MGVITIRPDQTIRDLIALLDEHNIGALPVLDEAGNLVGIISERDIIRQLTRDEAIFAMPVDRLMTKKVITAIPQDDLESVAHTMTEKRIRHLPILDKERLVGIVSIGDIVKAQRDEYRGAVDTLETQIINDT
jgi:CBS domain-containing protein